MGKRIAASAFGLLTMTCRLDGCCRVTATGVIARLRRSRGNPFSLWQQHRVQVFPQGIFGLNQLVFPLSAPALDLFFSGDCSVNIAGFFKIDQFFNTIAGSLLVSLFAEVFTMVPPITNDVLLASVFGSVLYGFGIGLTLVNGASTGGTDILGRLLQALFPYMKIGKLLMIIDGIVIAVSLILFREIDLALYGIIALFIATAAIDWLIQSLNISKLAFIVSDKGVEIAKKLTSESPRGVTIIDAIGGYTMEKKKVLMCALKENEMQEFQRRILEMDSTAFIIFSESQQIIGNGFRVYK